MENGSFIGVLILIFINISISTLCAMKLNEIFHSNTFATLEITETLLFLKIEPTKTEISVMGTYWHKYRT